MTGEPASFDGKSALGCVVMIVMGFMVASCCADLRACSEDWDRAGRAARSRPSRDCTRQHVELRAARERREALEERALSAVGFELAEVEGHLAGARINEAAADRAWRQCAGLD